MSSYSSPQVCPYCAGSGWERIESSGTVRRCRCGDSLRIEHLLADARIPKRYEHCSLDSYAPANESQERAKANVQLFVKKYPVVDGQGLLFLGTCGVGKTHLAVSLLKQVVFEKGDRGLFYDFRDLLREIQASKATLSPTSELEILRPVLEADVLVLDELGSYKPSEWVQDTVAHIINCRYNDKRVTIFTSNYPDVPSRQGEYTVDARVREESLTDRIGARLRSRLYEMCRLVTIAGEDFRRNIKQARF